MVGAAGAECEQEERCAATRAELLNVHLVCHSHDDVGWLKTVDQYYQARQRDNYRVSSKTVPTLLFALLSASTRANCKSWDIFLKFRKFAT